MLPDVLPTSLEDAVVIIMALRATIADQLSIIQELKGQVQTLNDALGMGNDAIWETFRLTPQLNRVLGLLLSVDFVSAQLLHEKLGVCSDIKACMLRLRRELADWRITVSVKKGKGYFLTDDMKERVRSLITRRVTDDEDVQEPVQKVA